jgi:hypothetical protein
MILQAVSFLLSTAAAHVPQAPAQSAQPLAVIGSGAQRVVVTSEGAFCQADAGTPAPTLPQPQQTAGLLWQHPDGGLLWIGNAVSIGNHGSEVFTEYDLNNEQTQLFSAYDTNPPTALWTDLAALGSDAHYVASAENGNVHVALRSYTSGVPHCQLSKYTSTGGGVPDWTYNFAVMPTAGTNVGISRNGQVIVAAASYQATSTVDIAVFSPASNVPLSYTTVPLGGTNNGIRGFDLSADGSTLYFSSAGNPVNANIFDIATTSVVFSTSIAASFDSHGISGDGSVFAFGNFGVMRVWQKIAGVYTNTINRNISGSCYCGYLDVSDDGSTVAYGFTFYSNYLPVQIEAIDVPSQAVTMSETVTATGSFQNIVSGVSCSADGKRFAVGLWGDGAGPVAEARLYSKTSSTPISALELGGSVFGLKISADGQRAAFGSKSVHANQFGNGGFITLLGDNTPFTNLCFGNGSLPQACPCANSGMLGRGCQNSSSTGGALLTAAGTVAPDTIVLTSSNELPHPLSIVLQGTTENANGLLFGDGVRCVSGVLKRLYTQNAVNGTVVAPGPGDLSITARSAALGDPISPGQVRTYQVYYRDNILSFCPNPPGDAWNVSSALRVNW